MKNTNKTVLLQVAQLGQPVLRKQAKEIRKITPRIQQITRDLMATLMDVNGVGIAAPQVYESIRLFIVASHPNPRYPKAPNMKPTAVINPKILSFSKEVAKDWEGCLSVPGIRAFVPRSTKIIVEFTSINGKIVKKQFKDFIARIFQHEYDHLEGKVFLDRIETTNDIVTDKEYLRMIAKK
ncbi:MAG: peptide deformylase [Candidatus Gottesmanbacteria bacterium]